MALAAPSVPRTLRAPGALRAAAVYWHLLSLDAPTVSALWSWSLAKAAHIELPAFAPLLLGVGTWLVYVADRLLDGARPGRADSFHERHFFYRRHKRAFFIAGAIVLPIFLWIVFTRMAPAVRREDSCVFALAALYFLLVHVYDRVQLPKELAVGVLFAMATAVPAWARTAGHRFALLPAVALFAMLCWMNCVAIACWERPDAPQEAHASTRWAALHFQPLAIVAGLAATALALASIPDRPVCGLYLATAAAALLLLALAMRRNRMTPLQLRIYADMALITPLLFVGMR